MDGQVRNLEEGVLGVPQLTLENSAIADQNAASKGQISIEPGMPEATSVGLNRNLLESKFVVHFCDWGQFEDWRVGMAANDLEHFDSLGGNFASKSEGHDGGVVPSEKVALSSFQSPRVYLSDLSESIFGKLVSTEVYCMEMCHTLIDRLNELLRVLLGFLEERFLNLLH